MNPDHALVLPDSRARDAKGLVMMGGEVWQPIYCANCGTEGGLCPQEHTTFFFWLCNDCFRAMGEITNLYLMPDEVFWQRVKDEQLEKYGRLLSTEELADVVAADVSPLATLVKQGH